MAVILLKEVGHFSYLINNDRKGSRSVSFLSIHHREPFLIPLPYYQFVDIEINVCCWDAIRVAPIMRAAATFIACVHKKGRQDVWDDRDNCWQLRNDLRGCGANVDDVYCFDLSTRRLPDRAYFTWCTLATDNTNSRVPSDETRAIERLKSPSTIQGRVDERHKDTEVTMFTTAAVEPGELRKRLRRIALRHFISSLRLGRGR